jgi:hypothetical protein
MAIIVLFINLDWKIFIGESPFLETVQKVVSVKNAFGIIRIFLFLFFCFLVFWFFWFLVFGFFGLWFLVFVLFGLIID